jgi:hypothetical protein
MIHPDCHWQRWRTPRHPSAAGLKARLAEASQLDPSIETTNGMPNQWSVRLFIAPWRH